MTSTEKVVRQFLLALMFVMAAPAVAQKPTQPPAPPTGLARLQANIEQIASSVDTHWGIYVKCDDRYTLKNADKRPGTGVIRSFDEGDTLTVKDLLTLMIIVSDNTATDVMRLEEHTSEFQSHSFISYAV